MSVNGDFCTLRNGRSTSKTTVYDYPEHLNPFYEDDNHKRLRFWNIGKNKNPQNNGRRSSFSFGGIKEMWAFKSFRMKKKSSTLGINKTSESPPALRRDFEPQQHYGTYDPKRGTGNAFDRNVPYRSSLQDMRATQTLDRSMIGFNRNDRYRSTIQTPNQSTSTCSNSLTRRYVYGGSVTPQPSRNNYNNQNFQNGYISQGSSQSSVNSTNPFDDEDDDDIVIGSMPSSPGKRTKKKRRAPPPPSQTNQIKEESPEKTQEILEISNLTAEIENFVKSSNEEPETNNTAKISSHYKHPTPPPQIIIEEYKDDPTPPVEKEVSLIIEETKTKPYTNEISQTTQVKLEHKPIEITETVISSESNNKYDKKLEKSEIKDASAHHEIEIVRTVKENNVIPEPLRRTVVFTEQVIKEKPIPPERKESRKYMEPIVITKTVITSEPQLQEGIIVTESKKNNEPVVITEKVTIGEPQSMKRTVVSVEKKQNGSVVNKEDNFNITVEPEVKVSEQKIVLERKMVNNSTQPEFKIINKEISIETIPQTPKMERKFTKETSLTPSEDTNISVDLKICESKEDVSLLSDTSDNSNHCRIGYSPLKDSSPELDNKDENISFRTKTINYEKYNSDDNLNGSIYRKPSLKFKPLANGSENGSPTPKRCSVKDIIASINKSQSLLKVNQPDNSAIKNGATTKQNIKSLEESEREIKRMLEELDKPNNLQSNVLLDDLADTINNNNNNNDDLFKKCIINKQEVRTVREQSPTVSNLDWNPIPKPKRTKNLK